MGWEKWEKEQVPHSGGTWRPALFLSLSVSREPDRSGEAPALLAPQGCCAFLMI